MIRIEVYEPKTRRWTELPSGPVNLSPAQWGLILGTYDETMSGLRVDPLNPHSPTIARKVIKDLFPQLSAFDRIAISNAVCMKHRITTIEQE